MRNVLPAFGSTVGSVLAAPGLRNAVLSGMHRALGGGSRGVMMYSHEWMRDMPKEAWKARHTYSLWAFPQADYPKLLGAIFRILQVILQAASLPRQRRQRREPPASGPRFFVQRELFGTHVHFGALIQRRTGLGRLSDRFQRFRVLAWRRTHIQSDAAPCSRNTWRRLSASAPSCSARCASAPTL